MVSTTTYQKKRVRTKKICISSFFGCKLYIVYLLPMLHVISEVWNSKHLGHCDFGC